MATSVVPDQSDSHSVVSDLGLHCLPRYHLCNTRRKWGNFYCCPIICAHRKVNTIFFLKTKYVFI